MSPWSFVTDNKENITHLDCLTGLAMSVLCVCEITGEGLLKAVLYEGNDNLWFTF